MIARALGGKMLARVLVVVWNLRGRALNPYLLPPRPYAH
jgi:hypothetical protein